MLNPAVAIIFSTRPQEESWQVKWTSIRDKNLFFRYDRSSCQAEVRTDCGWSILERWFKGKHFLLVNDLKKPIHSSWFAVWWWIKGTFVCTYYIFVDSRRIGFIGLNNLRLCKSVEISFFIFEQNMKHLGYGSKALILLAKNLRRFSFVDEIIAKVKVDNRVAISFYQKNGFKELYTEGHISTMSISLLNEWERRIRIHERRKS
jgi:RimJ/RimL family protein N-acetyltransferase